MSGDLKYLSVAILLLSLPYTLPPFIRSFICPSALHFVHSGIVLCREYNEQIYNEKKMVYTIHTNTNNNNEEKIL